MPIYEFTPTDLNHSDWETSSHKAACRVYASDEDQARHYADAQFRQATVLRSVYDDTPFSPWLNPARTECHVFSQSAPSEQFGRIEVANSDVIGAVNSSPINAHPIGGADHVWTAVAEGTEPGEHENTALSSSGERRTLDDVADFDSLSDVDKLSEVGRLSEIGQDAETGGNLRGAAQYSDTNPLPDSASVEGRPIGNDAGATTPISRDTVSRANANRTVLVFQSTQLLNHLEALIGPDSVPLDQRNAPPLAEALGIDEALSGGDLLGVLRELRDELRRLNDALENEELETEQLGRLQEIGLRALGTYAEETAKFAGRGTGGLILVGLGSLLDSTGLVSWGQIVEVLTATRG